MASQRHMACKIPKDAKKITTKKETSSTVELDGMLMRSKKIKSKIPIPTERHKMAKDSGKSELPVPKRKKQQSIMTACIEMPIEGAEVALVEMLVSVNENAKTAVGAEMTEGIEDHVGVEMPVRRFEMATVETQTGENLAEIGASEVATDEVPVSYEMAICAEMAEGVEIDVGVKVEVPISAVVSAIAEVSISEVSISEVAIAEVAIAEVAIAEVAIAEVAIAEVAIAEVSVAEVAIAEVAIAEVAVADVPSNDKVAIVEVPVGWMPKFAVDEDIEIKRLNTISTKTLFSMKIIWVDIHSLQNINEEALTTIFEEKSFYGPLQRFRAFHSKWLNNAGTTTTVPIPPQCDNESDSSESSSEFNLNSVLKKTEAGAKLIAYYDKKKSFIHDDRLELVKLIAHDLLSTKRKMGVKEFKEISNQITMVFAYEDKADYCTKKNGRNTGLLVIAYYNGLAAEKNKAKKSKNIDKRRQTSPDPENITDLMSDETRKAIDWMETHNPVDEDDEDAHECLLENWNYCFQYRTETIEKAENIDTILNEWPELKNFYGFHLLELDFETKFGDSASKFVKGWALFADQNLKILRKMIDEPDVKESLRALSDETAETNFHNITMILALQHLMAPATVVLKNSKRFKPTTETSKDWLFKLVETKDEIKGHLELLLTKRQLKKLEIYPVIFGIGEGNDSVSEFIVAFKEVAYTFETIIDALDAAFKCYVYFKIDFSPEHKRLWALLNGLFYKIDCHLETTPAVSSIIKSFVR